MVADNVKSTADCEIVNGPKVLPQPPLAPLISRTKILYVPTGNNPVVYGKVNGAFIVTKPPNGKLVTEFIT